MKVPPPGPLGAGAAPDLDEVAGIDPMQPVAPTDAPEAIPPTDATQPTEALEPAAAIEPEQDAASVALEALVPVFEADVVRLLDDDPLLLKRIGMGQDNG